MATRQFDYAAMQEIYSNMNKTIGSAADADSIAGVLHSLDQNVQEYIGVCDEAVYGPLGNQLLLDWLNTSSDFPNFVENFSNWSQLVAMSGGDYSRFEQDVAGFRELNPLGTYSGEATINFVDSEKYTVFTQDDIDIMSASVLGMYAEVGDAYFVDTNMVEYEKQRKTMDIIMFSIQGVTTVLSVIPVFKIIGTGGKFAMAGLKTGASTGAKALTTSGTKALTTTAAKATAKTGASILSKFGSKIVGAGSKVAGVARAAATGVTAFAKNMTTKAGRAIIVKSARSLIGKVPSALSKAGGKIVSGAKAAGKTIATTAKNTAGKASSAFKSLLGKSVNQTDDYIKYMKEVTKNLNKSASKVVVNGKTYVKPADLIDDFAKNKISYKDFNSGFKNMFNNLADPKVKQNACQFFVDQVSNNESFARAYYNGYHNILPISTSEAASTVIDVLPVSTKVSTLKYALYEFGLQGVQNYSQDALETPTTLINTGASA